MEFWGVEVKPGQTLEVKPEYNKLIHVSQAALDEVKNNNGANFVILRLKVNTKEFVIGSLSAGERRQLMLDLVFEKNFVLSHDWKNGSVFFCGYTAENPDSDGYSTEDEDGLDDDEEYPLDSLENGKLEPKVEKMKPAKNKATGVKSESSAKPTVTFAEPKKNEERKEEEGSESDDDDDDDDEEEDSSEAEEDSSDVPEEMDDSDDSDQIPTEDDSDDDDEHTPKKADLGTKRSFESVTKTPVPAKKAKSPQKTATPHPSKQAGKTSANSSKAKERIQKSTVKVSRKSCSKTFGSEKALELHTMAKHSGA